MFDSKNTINFTFEFILFDINLVGLYFYLDDLIPKNKLNNYFAFMSFLNE